MKKFFALMIVVVMVFALCACEQKAEPTPAAESATAAEEPFELAIIGTAIYHQFGQYMKAGAVDAAEKYGVKYSYDGPETDAMTDKQIEMVEAAIDRGVDCIVLSATDPEAFTSTLQRAKDEGILVVSMLNPVNNDIPATFVGSGSEFDAGYTAGEKMAEALGEKGGQVGLVLVDQFTVYSTGRRDGFVAGLTENCPNAEIVDIQYTEGDHLKSADATTAMINAYPDLKGFFANGEGPLTGLLSALKETGTEGNYIVVGFDSGSAQCAAIRGGWELGAMTQDPYHVGYYAVEKAIQILNGETVDPEYDVGFFWYDASTIDTPEILSMIYE